jgi:hypothetical protein
MREGLLDAFSEIIAIDETEMNQEQSQAKRNYTHKWLRENRRRVNNLLKPNAGNQKE